MTEVKLSIGGRSYNVACAEGEEDHVARLGTMIDDRVKTIGAGSGTKDIQNLLFGALLIADELAELQNSSDGAATDREKEIANLRTQARDGEKAETQRAALQAKVEEMERANTALQAKIDAKNTLLDRADSQIDEFKTRLSENGRNDSIGSRASAAKLFANEDGDLGPALERFADLLENCADKLEGKASAS